MLEQNISIAKLIKVLQRVKARDGIESITTFELLHILPSDEAVEQPRALDVCGTCDGAEMVREWGKWKPCPDCQDTHASNANRWADCST